MALNLLNQVWALLGRVLCGPMFSIVWTAHSVGQSTELSTPEEMRTRTSFPRACITYYVLRERASKFPNNSRPTKYILYVGTYTTSLLWSFPCVLTWVEWKQSEAMGLVNFLFQTSMRFLTLFQIQTDQRFEPNLAMAYHHLIPHFPSVHSKQARHSREWIRFHWSNCSNERICSDQFGLTL